MPLGGIDNAEIQIGPAGYDIDDLFRGGIPFTRLFTKRTSSSQKPANRHPSSTCTASSRRLGYSHIASDLYPIFVQL